MSFLVAAAWSILAVYGFDLTSSLLQSARAHDLDLVSRILCLAFAYLGTLIFFTLIHEKDRPLSEVFALRRTSLSLCLLAAAIGLALVGPLSLLSDAILRRFPLSEEDAIAFAEQFDAPLLHQKVAIVMGAGLLAPLVEEMFFRGALFRGLRRQHPPGLTLVGVSLLFAASHRELHYFLPEFLAALALGYSRALAGSLWPAVILHAAFNTVQLVFILRHRTDADMLSHPQSLAAAFAAVGLLALYRAVALRSETCAQARAEDAV
jgi:membrane protease YdiL (CAAX protease family)